MLSRIFTSVSLVSAMTCSFARGDCGNRQPQVDGLHESMAGKLPKAHSECGKDGDSNDSCDDFQSGHISLTLSGVAEVAEGVLDEV